MIRKIFLFLSVFLTAAVLAAAEYQVLVLGDIHYDAAEYHPSNTGNKWQLNERARNAKMWAGPSWDLLKTSAAVLNPSFPFIIQLGDFSQGDSDTPELQTKMLLDGFREIKKIFPDHPFLAVKGNHDYRLANGKDHAPFDNDFMKCIAKELGVPEASSNYAVRHGKDLFLFFDCSQSAKIGIQFVEKSLQDNPDTRYVFFLSHYPVFPCDAGSPGGIIPGRNKIRQLLAQRNAIILAGHTHLPSFASIDLPEGNLTQLILSSMGSQWKPEETPAILYPDFDTFRARVPPKAVTRNHPKKVMEEMAGFKIKEFVCYTGQSGFAVLKIDDKAVTAEIHTTASGKPVLVKTLRQR